jgi:hypothetical protein
MTEDCYLFFTGPGAETDDPAWNKLLRTHEWEAAKKKAEFYNYGWATDQFSICSKTSHGILSSEVDPSTMRVRHHWKEWDSNGPMAANDVARRSAQGEVCTMSGYSAEDIARLREGAYGKPVPASAPIGNDLIPEGLRWNGNAKIWTELAGNGKTTTVSGNPKLLPSRPQGCRKFHRVPATLLLVGAAFSVKPSAMENQISNGQRSSSYDLPIRNWAPSKRSSMRWPIWRQLPELMPTKPRQSMPVQPRRQQIVPQNRRHDLARVI